jgi:hypothetical protein
LGDIIIAVPRNEKNPLISQLYHEITEQHTGGKVLWGIDFFWEDNFQASICHIHWPEALFNWVSPTTEDLNKLETHIKNKKKYTKFVVTVHNYTPHNKDFKNANRLYSIIYSSVDAIIHFGMASEVHIKQAYNTNATHSIISHPLYESFGQIISSEKARERLGYNHNTFICMTFGTIRNEKELELILKGFSKAKIAKKKLVLIGAKMNFRHSFLKRVKYFLLKKIYTPSLVLENRNIEADEVRNFICAADCILIPRINSLNSGNLYLAITYDKIVVAPNIGVIGEIAELFNNPLFNPKSYQNLCVAIEQAYTIKNQPNKKKEKMTTKYVAHAHISLFKRLVHD